MDLNVELPAQSLAELDDILHNIRNLDGVTTSETSLLPSSRRGQIALTVAIRPC